MLVADRLSAMRVVQFIPVHSDLYVVIRRERTKRFQMYKCNSVHPGGFTVSNTHITHNKYHRIAEVRAVPCNQYDMTRYDIQHNIAWSEAERSPFGLTHDTKLNKSASTRVAQLKYAVQGHSRSPLFVPIKRPACHFL